MLIREFRRSITGAVALTVLLSAPAIAATPVDVGEGTDRPQGSNATVMVNNCNTLDVEIFAETEGGRRSRIGTVRRTTQHELKLPDWIADGTTPFRLRIYSYKRPIPVSQTGRVAEAVKTNPISVTPGERITLVVMSQLAESYILH